MIATCCRAIRDTKKGVGDGGAIELADTFCKASRRRIESLFAAIESNDDVSNYEVSKGILGGRYAWLEEVSSPRRTRSPTIAWRAQSNVRPKIETRRFLFARKRRVVDSGQRSSRTIVRVTAPALVSSRAR